MYSTKLINKNKVDNNAYITVGDPFSDAKSNPFRQGKKGEKLVPFRTKVLFSLLDMRDYHSLLYVSTMHCM